MNPTLSIIIVNYNAGPYLARCLDSLAAQTFKDFEILLVDNASKDGSLASVQARAGLRIFCNQDNIGFAAAQNQGMQLARGKSLMPLNFDIYLHPDYLRQATAALEVYPSVGTVSGKMLRMLPDGAFTEVFDNAGLLLTRRRMPLHRGAGEQDKGQFQQRDLVFGALGAAAIYRREMLEDIAYQGQFFDESYFMWYEDIDLDWRGRLRGWDCLYIPEALSYHIGDPQKNKISLFAARHSIRNRWQTILTDESLPALVRNLPWLVMEEVALLVYVLRSGRFLAYLQALSGLLSRIPALMAKRRWVRSRAVRLSLPEYPSLFSGSGNHKSAKT